MFTKQKHINSLVDQQNLSRELVDGYTDTVTLVCKYSKQRASNLSLVKPKKNTSHIK